jgi:hypothetical protein
LERPSPHRLAQCFAVASAVGALAWSAAASGSAIERLLMPGPLAEAHVKWEDDCSQCHDKKDRSQQTALCFACHKDIRADADQKRGLHGHAPSLGTACKACHTEHKGRTGDIVGLDRESFDHERSGYALTGKHASITCQSCHLKGKKFREVETSCLACHRLDDVHKGKLGTECGDCHTTASFRESKFDHANTHFPLEGAHKKVACQSCHRDPSYKGAPLECVACHHRDDVHKGGRGPDCAACHTVERWKTSKFDHERAAHFALRGRHADIACDACHRSGDMKAKIPKTCNGCHAPEDVHGGRFGDDCALCHNESRWKEAHYDHARDAHFPLNGAHEKLDCHSCHKVDAKTLKLPKDCIGCHRADDVHRTSLGERCQSCHNEKSWKQGIVFDHGLTHFPLVALHASVACEECHTNRAYKETKSDCYACHAATDVHKGSLGKACEQCHNPNGWSFWQFDHGARTKSHFALEGGHAIACERCHRESPDKVALQTQCASCHSREDVHQGRFGADCGRCHDAISFKHPIALH